LAVRPTHGKNVLPLKNKKMKLPIELLLSILVAAILACLIIAAFLWPKESWKYFKRFILWPFFLFYIISIFIWLLIKEQRKYFTKGFNQYR